MAGKSKRKSEREPKLRFPEFRRDNGWQKSRLIAVLSEEKLKSDGISEVHSVSLTKGVVPQVEHMGRSFAAADTSHYSLVRPFDVVYTKSPLAIFKLGIVKQHRAEHNAIVSPLYGVFTPVNRYVGHLVEAYFESPFRSLHYLDPLAQKGAKNTINITNNKFLSGEIYLPTNEHEQRAVSECLSSLDELIGAESRKLESLQAHKKGLMQQLFPREGKTVPRLRFPEFKRAPEWEEKPLDAVVDFQSGGTPSKQNPAFWNGTVPWVSAKDMKHLFLDDAQDHITNAAVEGGAKLVPAGTVLMLTRGMMLLKDLPICVVTQEMAFNQDVKAVRCKSGLNPSFLPYLLLGYRGQILNMVDVAGHGTGKLNTDELRTFRLAIPAPEEQTRIAECLATLEALIPGQCVRIDALRKHKKGLMQQLFPSLEDAHA